MFMSYEPTPIFLAQVDGEASASPHDVKDGVANKPHPSPAVICNSATSNVPDPPASLKKAPKSFCTRPGLATGPA